MKATRNLTMQHSPARRILLISVASRPLEATMYASAHRKVSRETRLVLQKCSRDEDPKQSVSADHARVFGRARPHKTVALALALLVVAAIAVPRDGRANPPVSMHVSFQQRALSDWALDTPASPEGASPRRGAGHPLRFRVSLAPTCQAQAFPLRSCRKMRVRTSSAFASSKDAARQRTK
jgi:hypothetical protein